MKECSSKSLDINISASFGSDILHRVPIRYKMRKSDFNLVHLLLPEERGPVSQQEVPGLVCLAEAA